MSKKRMQIEEFLSAYLKAADQGLTREEFARKIGVKPASVYQRVAELRRKLKERGKDLPLLGAKTRTSLVDRAEALLSRVGKPRVAEVEPAEDPLAELLS